MTRMERIVGGVRWALVVAAFAVAVTTTYRHRDVFLGERAAEPDRYHCPMHPEIRSPDPGVCPICSMQLEPIPDSTASRFDAGVPPLPPPPGHGVVELVTARAQAIGVHIEAVSEGAMTPTLRVPATLEVEDGATSEVRARVATTLRSLAVARIGSIVRRGSVLATGFSTEVATLDDELAAARALTDPGDLPARIGTRLTRLGVSAERRGERGTYALTAPRAGVVTRVDARPGAYVGPETLLYEIRDLDGLYLVASVPDSTAQDLAEIEARFEVAGRTYVGRFDSLVPEVDATTRRVRVRFRVDNADHALLPGTSVVAELPRPAHAGLTIPRDAVVDTGEHTYVFVDRGFGYFEPRTVEVEDTDGERVAIRAGLTAGERVVVRGTFLLDAESRIRGASMPAATATP